jgi:chromosome segregation ATPase
VPELTKEELLELDEVKSLLDEAKNEGASFRDDEVTALTDEAAELKDSVASLTEERDDAQAQSEQFKDGLDMVAEKFKNFLIDEIVYNRGVMGIENYTEGVDAAKEKLGARNVDSLLDAINDDREKLDASRQSLEPGSVSDPGTGLTDDDGDDDPTPDSKPNEILDSYLEGLGISFQSKTDE